MHAAQSLSQEPPRTEADRPRPGDSALLQVRQVARRLEVTEQHVIDLIRAGRLPGINIGTRRRKIWRIPVENFQAFLKNLSA